VVALLLIGCADAPIESASCAAAQVTSFSPADGEEYVSTDTEIQFTLDGPGEDVWLWMDGAASDGWVELTSEEETFSFAPPAELKTSEAYTVRVSTCGAAAGEARFTTLPDPVGESVLGETFELELLGDDLQWVIPGAKIVDAFRYQLESGLADTSSLLLRPHEVRGETIELVAALGTQTTGELLQDLCVPPVSVEADFSRDPLFAGSVEVLLLADDDEEVITLEELEVSGMFDPVTDAIADLRIAGLLDLRATGLPVSALCENADAWGAPCEYCADQDEEEDPVCLPLEAIDPVAPRVPGLVLDPDVVPGKECG